MRTGRMVLKIDGSDYYLIQLLVELLISSFVGELDGMTASLQCMERTEGLEVVGTWKILQNYYRRQRKKVSEREGDVVVVNYERDRLIFVNIGWFKLFA